ncbi:MAG: RluA family pseudouridine synthase [Verrucomicrobiota bacterium]|nr:RluA family pseudouridine synthase [Verrucomicrobiota bacterium]
MTLRSEIKPALSTSGAARANFRIIDETSDYIVVDKPPLLLVHPSKPDGARTLWGELRHLLAFEIANGGQVSIVNRLDRETSGIVLVAKTAEAARKFGLLMQQQQIEKQYLAIVWGWPEWETKTVHAPIARQGAHQSSPIYLKQMIHSLGAEARTEFRVEKRLPGNFSLVRAFPRTGRTHQIRVHLHSLGHSVIGDKIYGPNEQCYLQFIQTGWTDELQRELLLPRHALHSARLQIAGVGDWSSDLPPDLAEFRDALQ